MKPNLTHVQVNHLRRLLGWVRCEYGQEPAAYAEQAKEMITKLEGAGFKTSDDAKAYIAESYMHKASTPKYVRAAVRALEKLLVKQDGVIVDVASPEHRHPIARALPSHQPGIAGPVAGFDAALEVGGTQHASDPISCDGWSDDAPNEPGTYLLRSMENDYEAEIVMVTIERPSGADFLIVNCPHLGKIALSHYHAGLTDPSWKKLENQQ